MNLFGESLPVQPSRPVPGIAVNDAVMHALRKDAVIALNVSGGKDGHAMAIAVMHFLAEHGFDNEVLAIHADLGSIEWNDSLPKCREIADHLEIPLTVVHRPQGGMIEQWEQRWQDNLASFTRMAVTGIIGPWSSSGQRFCTSGQKESQINGHLNRTYTMSRHLCSRQVINAIGIRHGESTGRSRCPVSKPNGIKPGPAGPALNWFPMIDWTTEDVFSCIAASGMTPHIAYSLGNNRVSCGFCVLGCASDINNAAGLDEHLDAYRRLVDIEQRTWFSFQPSRWLMQVKSTRLRPDQQRQIFRTLEKAQGLKDLHAAIPPGIRFASRNTPAGIPTLADCRIYGKLRARIFDGYSLEHQLVRATDIREHIAELFQRVRVKEGKIEVSKPERASGQLDISFSAKSGQQRRNRPCTRSS